MFEQNLNTVIKVKKMEKKEIVATGTGVEYLVLKVSGQLMPSKAFVSVEKLVKKEGMHQYIQAKVDEFDNNMAILDMNNSKSLPTYAAVKLAPRKNKDGDMVQFDKIKTDVLADGRLFYKIDSFVDFLNSRTDAEGKDYVIFNGKSNTWEKAVDSVDGRLQVAMYVESVSDDIVSLTSGGNYPVCLVCNIPEASMQAGASPTIGQLYKLTLEFKKGQMIKAEKASAKEDSLELDFDNEEEIVVKKGATFAPDRLEILGVTKVKGVMLEGLGEGTVDTMMNDLLGI